MNEKSVLVSQQNALFENDDFVFALSLLIILSCRNSLFIYPFVELKL
jgi:hypothetical protein